MAELTRITTVELTQVLKNAEEVDMKKASNAKYLEDSMRRIFGCVFDDINVVKIQQFVLPDQPKPKLTKRERAFCELITDGYIARDGEMALCWHECKPIKDMDFYEWSSTDCGNLINIEIFDEIPFMFIQWEDDEPWAVEDLLKLEVEE